MAVDQASNRLVEASLNRHDKNGTNQPFLRDAFYSIFSFGEGDGDLQ